MKKNIYSIIILTIIFIVSIIVIITYNSNKQKKIKYQKLKIPFKNAISIIYYKVGDYTPSDLLNIDEFLCIYANSDYYFSNAELFLEDTNVNEKLKIIVVYSMQNLSYNNYINFFIKCSNLFKRKIINENVIIRVINPGMEWNKIIINNFYKQKIRKELNDLKKAGGTGQFTAIIDEIKSGRGYWKVITK
jgi:hypothetical protein